MATHRGAKHPVDAAYSLPREQRKQVVLRTPHGAGVSIKQEGVATCARKDSRPLLSDATGRRRSKGYVFAIVVDLPTPNWVGCLALLQGYTEPDLIVRREYLNKH